MACRENWRLVCSERGRAWHLALVSKRATTKTEESARHAPSLESVDNLCSVSSLDRVEYSPELLDVTGMIAGNEDAVVHRWFTVLAVT